MINTGKVLRSRRLMKNGRTVIVPIDHSLYFGPIAGLENPRQLVRSVAAAGADAVLLSPGLLEVVAGDLGEMAVILRIDGTHTRLGGHLERIDLISSVAEAARLGVEAVVVNVFVGADNEDVLLAKLGKAAADCREFGVLLVAEMIPQPILAQHYGKNAEQLDANKRAEYIALASRLGAEIGADMIKTHYSGTVESFKTVTSTATRPVVIAGGVKSGDDRHLLDSIADAMAGGAAGACIGRNLWQRDNVTSMTAAIRAIVHDGAASAEAFKMLVR